MLFNQSANAENGMANGTIKNGLTIIGSQFVTVAASSAIAGGADVSANEPMVPVDGAVGYIIIPQRMQYCVLRNTPYVQNGALYVSMTNVTSASHTPAVGCLLLAYK